MRKLLPCPFCKQHLAIRKSVNPYGRCETEGCWMNEAKIAVPLDDAVQVSAFNTRRAPAPCDELETVAYKVYGHNKQPKLREIGLTDYEKDWGFSAVELVTRQNAEEVIVAKGTRIAALWEDRSEALKNNSILEADNTAKGAEIAELKKLISSTHKNAVKHTECEAVNCPICDGGLFVCADCGAAEIETEQRICTGSTAADNKRLREALADTLAALKPHVDTSKKMKEPYEAPLSAYDRAVEILKEGRCSDH